MTLTSPIILDQLGTFTVSEYRTTLKKKRVNVECKILEPIEVAPGETNVCTTSINNEWCVTHAASAYTCYRVQVSSSSIVNSCRDQC